MIQETGRLLQAAQDVGQAVAGLTPEAVFELVLALSWAIDRYGDTEDAARNRTTLGTAGVFKPLVSTFGQPGAQPQMHDHSKNHDMTVKTTNGDESLRQ